MPTEDDAAGIALRFACEPALRVRRFPAGLAHFVYDVTLRSGRALVVRIGAPGSAPAFAGAVYWSRTLRPLGVPLPDLLASGERDGAPFLVLERLPGFDLGAVYAELSREEKRALAAQVADVQACVARLPEGRGFGYALHQDGPFRFGSWTDLVRASLARSRRRIEAAGVVSLAALPRLERAVEQQAAQLDRVAPRAFLDDTTTKNVIVDGGCLSGIVDVDWVCYGDPLFPVALTRTALLSEGHDVDYVDAWCEQLAPDAQGLVALRLYTALFCADFLSEAGHAFNRERPVEMEDAHARRLTGILEEQLAGL